MCRVANKVAAVPSFRSDPRVAYVEDCVRTALQDGFQNKQMTGLLGIDVAGIRGVPQADGSIALFVRAAVLPSQTGAVKRHVTKALAFHALQGVTVQVEATRVPADSIF